MIVKGVNSKIIYPPNSGILWDSTDNPDVYLQVFKELDLLYTEPIVHTNASYGETIMHQIDSDIIISAPTENYFFLLSDRDERDEDDFIGSFHFPPYVYGHDFPNPLEVSTRFSATGLELELEVFVEYEF